MCSVRGRASRNKANQNSQKGGGRKMQISLYFAVHIFDKADGAKRGSFLLGVYNCRSHPLWWVLRGFVSIGDFVFFFFFFL